MKKTLHVLRMTFLVIGALIWSADLHAQEVKVSGTVTSSADKTGMPGVNVLIKGTSVGTTTDVDGKYTLMASDPSDVLVYSFIGYASQETAINGRSVIDITLEATSRELDEVIVVGYSEKKKSEITGAVVNVSADKLKGVTGSSVEYQLQGKVAGVQVTSPSGEPGAVAEIHIRGTSSLTAGRTSLIVVDGIIGGAYNPNDVESVTVLKDAGAIALYGSQANSGVVIITTKKGVSEKPEITYRTTIGNRNINTGHFKMMGSDELYNTERLMFAGSAQFQQFRPDSLLNRNTDWVNLAYKQGIIQNHNLSVRGKSGKVGYYIAGDYYNEEGTLLTTKYDRINFRSNLDFDLSKAIRLTTNFNVTSDRRNSYHWRWTYQPFLYLPYDSPYDRDGNIRYVDANTPGFLTRDKNNILHSALYNDYKSRGVSLNGDVILTAKIAPWITVQSRNRVAYSSYRSDNYEDSRTIEGAANNGVLSFGVSDGYSVISTNLVRLSKDFGQHQIGGFVGFEGSQYANNDAGASGYGIVPGIKVPGGIASPQGISGTKISGAAMSFLSEINYNYNEKYFASVSLRRDGSSTFGPDNRWGNFGALSGSWVISKEDFFAGLNDKVTFLKLRGSYGIVGNANIGAFQYLSTYNFATQYNGGSAGYPSTLANSKLGWEQTKASDLGLDITLFNRIEVAIDGFIKDTDRLLFSVPLPPSQGIDHIYRNAGRILTKGLELGINGDVLRSNKVTWNVGFNIASASNRVKSLADAVSMLPRSFDGVKQAAIPGYDMNSYYLPKWAGVDPANGDPLWEVLTRDAEGNVTGVTTTNQYSIASQSDNLQRVGTATAKFYGGLSTSVTYSRFTLSIASAFQYGNKIYHSTREYVDADGANFNFNMMSLSSLPNASRWQSPGDIATHPKPVYGGNHQSNKASSRYLEDGSFLRIRNILLTYNIAPEILSKLHLSKASIFVSGDNLFTFTKFSGLDPETQVVTTSNQASGISYFKYPLAKQYLLGVQFSF